MKKLNESPKRINFIWSLLIVLSLVLTAGAFVYNQNVPNDGLGVSEGINYEATVCRTVERYDEASGLYINDGTECSHNLLTNAGKELIESALGNGGTGGPVQYIALCNASAGCTGTDASDTSLDNEYTTSGLARAQGTYTSIGTGNWTIHRTFTASADNLLTNQTGLLNASSGGTLFAENTFSLVTLQTNDQLTLNWTVSVS